MTNAKEGMTEQDEIEDAVIFYEMFPTASVLALARDRGYSLAKASRLEIKAKAQLDETTTRIAKISNRRPEWNKRDGVWTQVVDSSPSFNLGPVTEPTKEVPVMNDRLSKLSAMTEAMGLIAKALSSLDDDSAIRVLDMVRSEIRGSPPETKWEWSNATPTYLSTALEQASLPPITAPAETAEKLETPPKREQKFRTNRGPFLTASIVARNGAPISIARFAKLAGCTDHAASERLRKAVRCGVLMRTAPGTYEILNRPQTAPSIPST